MYTDAIQRARKDQNNQKNFFHDQDYIQKWEVKYFQLNAGAGAIKVVSLYLVLLKLTHEKDDLHLLVFVYFFQKYLLSNC
jgi:hypothetical protein